MKKLTIIFSAIAICFGITINTFAQKGKPSSSPTPTPSPTPTDVFVEAKFVPIGSDGTTTNKITMDNESLSYVHGAEGVEARFFGASRDLVIRLSNSTRSIWVDMREVTSITADTPSWVYTPFLSKPHMNVLGAYYAKENCKTPVTDTNGNSVYNCDFITRTNGGSWYVSGGTSYALLWNPETINPRPVNSPEKTSLVNVNYYKGVGGQEVFTITPLPNCATRTNLTCEGRVIAGLERSKGNSVTNAGQYVMPFTLVVSPLP